ncbi:multidrug efflux system protein [Escherichia coli]|uniref:Multidrug efflux system protein n=1 Tax=Escherichia coli TaxID=562 RepID=A0A3S4MG05_ECOLX|nr:multidrug efflux system protein [Escherichia coli]
MFSRCLPLAALGFSGQGQNNGLAFISLKPWSERVGEENSGYRDHSAGNDCVKQYQ